MGDSKTVRNSRSASVSAAFSRIRSLLSEKDAHIADLVGQLSGRDTRLAEMEVQLSEQAGLVCELWDEILRLNRQPKRPNLKPAGLARPLDQLANIRVKRASAAPITLSYLT